jgi:hypothetical protein
VRSPTGTDSRLAKASQRPANTGGEMWPCRWVGPGSGCNAYKSKLMFGRYTRMWSCQNGRVPPLGNGDCGIWEIYVKSSLSL